MRYRFGEPPEEKDSRASRIRAVFEGGRTVAAHTEYCMSIGYWTETELRARARWKCQDEVRDALGALVDGLPFAGPMAPRLRPDDEPLRETEKVPRWRQRELWEHEDYAWNIRSYLKRGADNVHVANRLILEDQARYGSPAAHWDIRSTDDVYFDRLDCSDE